MVRSLDQQPKINQVNQLPINQIRAKTLIDTNPSHWSNENNYKSTTPSRYIYH